MGCGCSKNKRAVQVDATKAEQFPQYSVVNRFVKVQCTNCDKPLKTRNGRVINAQYKTWFTTELYDVLGWVAQGVQFEYDDPGIAEIVAQWLSVHSREN